MISAQDTFNGTFPFKPNFSTAPGFNMHYVDQGTGPTVLCLHGEPTWGYLFRHLINQLSDSYRVVVPDHMGFGKSQTPSDRTYWLQDHIHNLEKFIFDLGLKDITLIINDFGGPIGMGIASRHPELITRIISVNGPTPFGQPELRTLIEANFNTAPWFQWTLQAEKNGRLEAILGDLHYNILSTLKLNGFERNDLITDNWLTAYRSPFVNAEDCLGASGWAKGMVAGMHIFEEPTETVKSQISKLPAMAIWGKADRTLQPQYFLPLFKTAFPDGLVYEIESAGHYSLEDSPEVINLLIRQFLDLTSKI
jgi:pimeloyl-ACP methyl ester carboxylesterase